LARDRAAIASGTRPENPGRVRALRRAIARVLTVEAELAKGIRKAAPKTPAKAEAAKTAKAEAAKPEAARHSKPAAPKAEAKPAAEKPAPAKAPAAKSSSPAREARSK
jgi:hypothetical protein